MSTKSKSTETPKPAAPKGPAPDLSKSTPTPTQLPAPENAPLETKVTTAAAIVADDRDKFPSGAGGVAADPNAARGTEQPSVAPADNRGIPARNVGGRPKGSKDSFRRGRPGRKDWPNEPITPPKPRKEGEEPEFEVIDDEPERQAPNYTAMADFLVTIGTGTLVQVFGPEWTPRLAPPGSPMGTPDEKTMMVTALAKYFESTEMPDIPPGVMCAIVFGMYAAPRLTAPATRSKLRAAWDWVSGIGRKIMSMFTRRPSARPPTPGTWSASPAREAIRPQPVVPPVAKQAPGPAPIATAVPTPGNISHDEPGPQDV